MLGFTGGRLLRARQTTENAGNRLCLIEGLVPVLGITGTVPCMYERPPRIYRYSSILYFKKLTAYRAARATHHHRH